MSLRLRCARDGTASAYRTRNSIFSEDTEMRTILDAEICYDATQHLGAFATTRHVKQRATNKRPHSFSNLEGLLCKSIGIT